MTLGFISGIGICLAVGASALAVGEDGSYPTDDLRAWLRLVAVIYAATLAVAVMLLLRGRDRLAGGLALGATLGTVVAPGLVFIDILLHSE